MNPRLPALVLLLAVGLAIASPAAATVGPPIRIRWVGDWPTPARAGVELSGTISLEAARSVRIENLTIGGEGWTRRGDLEHAFHVPAGDRRFLVFRAVPVDPSAPLVVTGTANGIAFRQEFRLDAATLERIGRPGTVRAGRAPLVTSVEKVAGPRTAGGAISIRVRGRIMYVRPDQVAVEADNVVVIVMDQDPVSDEEIGRFVTDSHGAFDVTLNWDDCDATGCDPPDLYMIYEAANLVVEVRHGGSLDTYRWSNEDDVIADFPGGEIDFGVHFPGNDDAALHAFTSIVRTHRFAQQRGGLSPPHVHVDYPEGSGAAYYPGGWDEIDVPTSEVWSEGVLAHEYGHHLSYHFAIWHDPTYQNGFCDPGHCRWCPENTSDAWQEGWANWLGARVVNTWQADYGPTPLSLADWDGENLSTCPEDNQLHLNGSTEGVIMALLYDLSDAGNEDADGGAPDCDQDVLALGDDEIFQVFSEDDPVNIGQFISAFRLRWPEHDANLWATIGNVVPVLKFTQPPPTVTTQAAKCRAVRIGERFELSVGTDGALHKYQWRRGGIPIDDTPAVLGTKTATLVFDPVSVTTDGSFDCVVTTCDGTYTTTSEATRIEVQFVPDPRAYLAWGENAHGQVGDGTTSNSRPATVHPTLQDIIEVEGGRTFTMALRKNGKLLTWGQNNSGELGHPGFVPQLNTPTEIASLNDVIRISAGRSHSLALLRDGTVRSWGAGIRGALGNGDYDGRGVPAPTLPFPTCVRELAASDDNSYFLLEDGTVWAAGLDDYGNLGTGATGPRQGTPQPIPGLTNVVAIDAAGQQAMALKADGTVWTWGLNHWGQLGLGHFGVVTSPTQVPGLANISQISAGLDNCYALRGDGIAFAAGYGPALGQGWNGGASNTFLQIPLTNITRIQGGADWAAVLIDGRLKAFGLNAAVQPPDVGVFNTTSPYVTGTPTDVPQVRDITTFGAGWGTLHAIGSPEIVDVPIAGGDVPAVLALAVGPNPAREAASVRFDLPAGGPVTLAVYDVAGRTVRTLADGEAFEPGRHARAWDGASNAGARVPAGVYFVRMLAPGGALTRTVVRVD